MPFQTTTSKHPSAAYYVGKGGSAGVQKTVAGHGRTTAEVQKTPTVHSTHAHFYEAQLRKVVCRDVYVATAPRTTRGLAARNKATTTMAATVCNQCSAKQGHDDGGKELRPTTQS